MCVCPEANQADAFSPNDIPAMGQLTLETDDEETRRRPYSDEYAKSKDDRSMNSDRGECTQVEADGQFD